VISDRDAVLAEAATYAGKPPAFASRGNALAVYLSEIAGELVVACQGTHNTFGWAVDFTAWPVGASEPVGHQSHPSLPKMHAGFRDVVLDVLPAVRKAVKGRIYHLPGHSLGGACALALAGYLADEGEPPASLFLFAPARVFLDPPDVLAPVPLKGWRCGGDIVPEVPPLYWRPLLTHFDGPADESSHGIDNFVGFIR
jgi:hypothetical protein